ncbi:MAG: N-acetyl-gamma-glutamyl-phosphate reductase [Phycisphaerae bacterium]|nr:N-acetyl-gamma-glutamyl-phosphate reductase [Phycisphaerae bacterium]
MPKRIAVVGASGYAGAELVGLLLGHPEADVIALRGSSRRRDAQVEGASRFSDLFPKYLGLCDLDIGPLDRGELVALEPDAVFLATPHELSHELAPELVARGIVTFDLSAAFRLSDINAYPKHYGFTHAQPALLRAAAYGLPELFAPRIAQADLVACPGCYPTSVILPLRPLADAGLLRTDREIIVDSASGVSGAGRKADTKNLFCEVSLQAYAVFSHRHRPEMTEYAGRPICFTPHLVAFERGILSTIHAWLVPGADERAVRDAHAAAYGTQPFVRRLAPGQWPSVAAVRGTNFCDIGVSVEGDHLVIESTIDNLVKGAAGQAVQCMNIRFGFPQTLGLIPGASTKERAWTI